MAFNLIALEVILRAECMVLTETGFQRTLEASDLYSIDNILQFLGALKNVICGNPKSAKDAGKFIRYVDVDHFVFRKRHERCSNGEWLKFLRSNVVVFRLIARKTFLTYQISCLSK